MILPHGIGRVVQPLLGGFVALQKDTALVNIVGIINALAQPKIYATNHYNLSAVTTVCIFFILITIPQTRFVDYLLARRARSANVGSS
ncbi:ABC-type amino acid transport system permease subunit [Ochrobactrum sp. P6BSIII]|nr:ABC-type amino acid transport system permease subunit [Ochrobactrum sp. P6BSIII]